MAWSSASVPSMGKKRRRSEHWKAEPDEHDFPAAADYLSLLLPAPVRMSIVERLRDAEAESHKAKDLLRASRLTLLPRKHPNVEKYLEKVARGSLLSPVLLVRGHATEDLPLVVADGYHRICASYHLDEDADIPCRIVDLP